MVCDVTFPVLKSLEALQQDDYIRHYLLQDWAYQVSCFGHKWSKVLLHFVYVDIFKRPKCMSCFHPFRSATLLKILVWTEPDSTSLDAWLDCGSGWPRKLVKNWFWNRICISLNHYVMFALIMGSYWPWNSSGLIEVCQIPHGYDWSISMK